ncbi:MAG: PAS domain-containing protein [Gemmatimonadales bacterium]|nr:PAS domain-containing protein [Gemmatimonadales bacterium]
MPYRRTFTWFSIPSIPLFLIIHAWIDSLFFNDNSFMENLFHPTPHEFFMLVLFIISVLAVTLAGRRDLRRLKMAQDRLEASENRYKTLVETSPACIVAHRKKGIVFANQPTLDLFKVSNFDRFRDVSVMDFIPPQFKDSISQRMESVWLTGRNTPLMDIQILMLDGTTKDISITTTRIEFEGKPTLLTFFQDLTDLKETHRDLLASQERLQLAMDAAQDGLWDWNIQSGDIVYNEAWAKMLGYQLADLKPGINTWEKLIHPGDLDRAHNTLHDHLNGRTAQYESELRLRHGKGHYLWILDRGRIVERDTQGNPTRMAGTHRNITIRKEAELALEIRNRVARIFLTEQERDIYSNIIKMVCEITDSDTGLFGIVDHGGRLRITATCRLENGKPMAENQGAFALAPDDLPPFFRKVFDRRKYAIQNNPLPPFDGHIKMDNAMAIPIVIGDLIVGLIIIANRPLGFNLSDASLVESLAVYMAPILQSQLSNQEKEAQLRQAQKMEALGALAGGIAHDFNNILQAILGFTTLAKEQAESGGPLENDLSRVLKAAGRGKNLVQSILLFSRREEHEYYEVAVQPIVEEAVDFLKPTIPATIEVLADLNAGDAKILADPSQISQVVLNLATNAFHAMEDLGGILTISINLMPGSSLEPEIPAKLRGLELVEILVGDTGCGMTPEVMDRLFDPFFTTKEVGKGTGLGLSVVHGIVVAHQGEILISSEPGCGTVARVFLPAITEFNRLTVTVPESTETSFRGRILFVDDEKDIADFGEAVLIRAGHDVKAIRDSREALALFRKDPGAFDLLITDLTMPHVPGLQLASEVTSLRPDLPVILITGMSDKTDWELGPRQMITAVIRKPFAQETLCSKVETIFSTIGQKGELGTNGENSGH